jgi:hypothetical protein
MASLRRVLLLGCFPSLFATGHCGGSSSTGFQNGGSSGATGDAGGAGGAAGNAGSAGKAGNGGTALADVPGMFAPAVCETAAQCYGPLLEFLLGGNSCTGFLTKQIAQSDFALLDAAVAKGTVEYDGTKVAACLEAIRSKGCAILSTRLGGLCSDVLHGTVAAGQACAFNAECTPGLFCKTTTCPGVCTSLLAEGAACESDSNCQDGLQCSDQKVCKKSVGLDLTGGSGAACDPTAAKLCQDGLFCAAVSIAGSAPVFQCEAPPASGCHVAFPEECSTGQFCKLPPNVLEGACTPVPKAGEPCGKYSPGDSRFVCAAGTTCDVAAGNCVAFQDLGGSCNADNQCYSKSCSTAGSCVASKCAN